MGILTRADCPGGLLSTGLVSISWRGRPLAVSPLHSPWSQFLPAIAKMSGHVLLTWVPSSATHGRTFEIVATALLSRTRPTLRNVSQNLDIALSLGTLLLFSRHWHC